MNYSLQMTARLLIPAHVSPHRSHCEALNKRLNRRAVSNRALHMAPKQTLNPQEISWAPLIKTWQQYIFIVLCPDQGSR